MREKTLRTLEYNKILNKIAEFAGSSIGKDKILNMVPYSSILKINDSLNKLRDSLKLGELKGYPEFTGLNDITESIKKARIGGTLTISNLYDAMIIFDSIIGAKSYYNDVDVKNSITELIDLLYIDKSLYDDLNRAILDRETISDNASNKLSSLLKKIGRLNDDINEKLKAFISSSSNEKYLQDSIITLREGRYVIPVKKEYKNFVKGIVHDVSGSGGTYFIEPQRIVDLNNEIRVVEKEIQEEKLRILKDLSKRIGSLADEFIYSLKIIGELDVIFAKAKYGTSNYHSIPNICDSNEVNLVDIFHPLIDPDVVVKTTVKMDKDTKALIITGPNTGGKTVILKTVGLISLLAQSGCMVPASSESKIPLYKEIFTDIGDEQSIEQSLSTFSSHMVNIIDILKYDGDKALYLFDELGAGTDPTEGAALAMSIIDILKNGNIKLIASTHYAELKIYALNTEGVMNGSMQFSLETLRPTFKLILGLPGKSNAFEISKKLGLSDKFISKAHEFIDDTSLKFESVLKDIEEKREQIEYYKEEHENMLVDAQKIKEEALEYKKKIEAQSDRLIEKAKKESKELYEKAKSDYENIIKDANATINNINKDSARRIQETRDNIRHNINKMSKKNINSKKSNLRKEDLHLGQTVRVISIDQVGEVLSLPNENGDLQIKVGILKINSNIKDIEKENKQDYEPKTRKKYRIEKSKYIKPEIDLRGVDSEELYDRLDKYIDDAFIAGLKEVTIVHGKGTGILRKATENFLKKNTHVLDYRLGKVGEGDTGVTVVTLK